LITALVFLIKAPVLLLAELILSIEQLAFMVKKLRFGDDRFLPSPPPNSPVRPKRLLTLPHAAPPCQAAPPARRLQTGQLTCFTHEQPDAVSQTTAEV
jgi:hypothetical protein